MGSWYDLAVVGAGHAGCEAALAAARMGLQVVLIDPNMSRAAHMPCNPAIGGPGKSQLVREIDALGGEMARNADRATVHGRILNDGKGPAVRSMRVQTDRWRYSAAMRQVLESTPGLRLLEDVVVGLLSRQDGLGGVCTASGAELLAPRVIITTGTFLAGLVWQGHTTWSAGRQGECASSQLSGVLAQRGITLRRLKTGTPPRLHRATVDVARMQEVPSDPALPPFSYATEALASPHLPTWLTYTSFETHRLIREHRAESPLYSGRIVGTGPRHCPSIEDKVIRFGHRERHPIFVEPDGLDTAELYLQGFSTSLPARLQPALVHSVPGLERARIVRFAYAIEYDAIDPRDLYPWLECRAVPRLYFAGQVNGTSGYEEAGAQGIVAGISAALAAMGKDPYVPARTEAYLGVLIDDLTTKGAPEPYRMLTARAEHRLLLRQDNADERLMPVGYHLGLIGEALYRRQQEKYRQVQEELRRLAQVRHEGRSLLELLRQQQWTYQALAPLDPERRALLGGVVEQVELRAKYAGYIALQEKEVARARDQEAERLPEVDYSRVPGLSHEARAAFSRVLPTTLGQAVRLPGVSPADLVALRIHLRRLGAGCFT